MCYVQGKKSVKIIHVDKLDSDMGLVLTGGKGVDDGSIVITEIQPGRSAYKYVTLNDHVIMIT